MGTLYVRLRGAVAAVQAACQSHGRHPSGQRHRRCQTGLPAATTPLPWFAQRAQQPDLALWRLSLPATAPVLALPAAAQPLVEWHGALRWVQAPASAGDALRAAAEAVGGSASVFVAASAGPESASGQFDPKSAALARIHARVKQAFDPLASSTRAAWPPPGKRAAHAPLDPPHGPPPHGHHQPACWACCWRSMPGPWMRAALWWRGTPRT